VKLLAPVNAEEVGTRWTYWTLLLLLMMMMMMMRVLRRYY
jgi:hypothetical protein